MKMLTKYRLVFTLLFAISIAMKISAQNYLEAYHKANIAYQQNDYAKAIELYENLLSQGQYAPELYFNLGNAWYKKGNIPKSILNYERALKMSPKDEDIQFNLKMASLQLVDKIDPVPQIFYKRWINSFTQLLSANEWSKLTTLLLWLSLICSVIYLFGFSVSLRKTGFILSLVFLVFFIFAFFFSGKSYSDTHLDQSAIVMSPSVYVKSSPDSKGNDLFIIHEGTKVELLDELNDWKKIRLVNGSIGWILNSEIEII